MKADTPDPSTVIGWFFVLELLRLESMSSNFCRRPVKELKYFSYFFISFAAFEEFSAMSAIPLFVFSPD